MSLSCSCGEYEPRVGEWYWYDPSNLHPMPSRERRAKCCSCERLIDEGEAVVEYPRYLCISEDSIDYRTHAGDKPLASWFECEECTELREAIEELGYCVSLGDSMRDLIAEINDNR